MSRLIALNNFNLKSQLSHFGLLNRILALTEQELCEKSFKVKKRCYRGAMEDKFHKNKKFQLVLLFVNVLLISKLILLYIKDPSLGAGVLISALQIIVVSSGLVFALRKIQS